MKRAISDSSRKKKMNKEALEFQFMINGHEAKKIPITSTLGERFSEANSSYEDIKFAQDCFKLALTIHTPHLTCLSFNENRNTEDLLNDALCRAAIMSYARTFSSTDSGRCQLGTEKLNEQEKEIHNELIRIRNSYIAHAGYAEDDKNAYEFIGTYILLDPQNISDPQVYAHNRRANGFPIEKIQDFLLVIEKQISIYKQKLQGMRKNLYDQEAMQYKK